MKSIILFQLILLAIQGITYLLVQHTKRPVHDMSRSVDQKIPLVPQFIYIYVLWYPLIAAFPLMLYVFDSAMYSRYIVSIIIDVCVSLLVYWFYPTTFMRPKPKKTAFSGKVLALMYIVDYRGRNCMPSMHCSQCFIIMFYALSCASMPVSVQTGLILLCTGIVTGTVFTKQHVLIDVITALPLSILCILAAFLI